jgi:enoyl-CoA hydratase/carnithine racemase
MAYIVHNTLKPVVCGVNGVAFGGGFELAMLCDVIVFKEDARVGLPELNLGLMPGMGGTQRYQFDPC